MKGVSAPYYLATVAIFSESVDTIARSIRLTTMTCSMAQAIMGFPHNEHRFLPGQPLEPPRAVQLQFGLAHLIVIEIKADEFLGIIPVV